MHEFTFEQAVAWATDFASKRKVEFSEDQANMAWFAVMSNTHGREKQAEYDTLKQRVLESPACKIVDGRFRALGLTPYSELVMFMSSLSGVPGQLVQYVSALSILVINAHPDRLTVQLHDYVEHIGEGMLTEESLHESWLSQKDEGSNLLDRLQLPINNPNN